MERLERPVPKRTRISGLLPPARAEVSWLRAIGAYDQLLSIIRNPDAPILPPDIFDQVSVTLDHLHSGHSGSETEFRDQVLAVLGNLHGFEYLDEALALYHDPEFREIATRSGGIANRWWPTPVETFVETVRRIRDARRIAAVLSHCPTSCILTGSVSYGAFYNVHGEHPTVSASDLDLLLIIPDAHALPEILGRLERVDGLSSVSLRDFAERAHHFVEHHDDDENTILSHKLRMWLPGTVDPMLAGLPPTSEYKVSMHVITDAVFSHVMVESATELRAESAGKVRTVYDFRDQPATQSAEQLRTFAGKSRFTPAVAVPVEGGFLKPSRVYYLDDDGRQYYPGPIQCQVNMAGHLLWDNIDLKHRLERFSNKVRERLDYEKGLNPYTPLLQISLADIRREHFAPHIREAIDNGYGPRR